MRLKGLHDRKLQTQRTKQGNVVILEDDVGVVQELELQIQLRRLGSARLSETAKFREH